VSRAAATALRLLTTLGTSATLTSTDATTGLQTTRTAACAIVGAAKGPALPSVVVEAGDYSLLMESGALPVDGDAVDVADLELAVVHAEPIYDRATVAVWQVWGRRR
jgi:hypothetical protein